MMIFSSGDHVLSSRLKYLIFIKALRKLQTYNIILDCNIDCKIAKSSTCLYLFSNCQEKAVGALFSALMIIRLLTLSNKKTLFKFFENENF